MVDPTTVNTSLATPIRGSDVGTWDLPVNGNFTIIDSMFGGVTTVAVSGGTVTLLSSQGQQAVVRLTGTSSANVNVVLSSIIKGWTFDNQVVPAGGFSVFVLTPGSTFALGLQPGQNDIFYDGTGISYRNLGKIGEYWDYAGTAVPGWVSGSTKPPYLLCNGTTFSSATYPILSTILGSTTLPDARGRVRAMLNLGSSRISSSISGFSGDTLFAAGGDQLFQSHTHTSSGTTSGVSANHTHTGSGTVPVSGTTSIESATHTHTGSGTTSTESSGHTHAGSGTTSTDSVDHTHTYNRTTGGILVDPGSTTNLFNISDFPQTGGVSAFHTHTYSFTTGSQSLNHTHSYSFTSSTQSANHTHTFSASGAYNFTTSIESADHTHTFSVTTGTAGTGGSQNVQPTFVGGITMIRAA